MSNMKSNRSMARRIFGGVWMTGRIFTRTTVTLLLVGSLALNVATVTLTGVFTAVSGLVGGIAGASSTVLGRTTARVAAQTSVQAAAVKSTTRRVRTRVARTAARGAGTAVVEALPFIGAGAVVTTVALDIADACATARDMHALEFELVPGTDPEFSCTDAFGDVMGETTTASVLAQVREAPLMVCASARDYAGGATLEELPEWVADTIANVVGYCPSADSAATSAGEATE